MQIEPIELNNTVSAQTAEDSESTVNVGLVVGLTIVGLLVVAGVVLGIAMLVKRRGLQKKPEMVVQSVGVAIDMTSTTAVSDAAAPEVELQASKEEDETKI